MLTRSLLRAFLAVVAAGYLSAAVPALQDAAASKQPWLAMDYGPFLTATFEVEKDNFAYKGIAIRLDDGPGGVAAGEEFVVFDTDLLRYAAGWWGPGLCDWRNIAFDGSHQTHSKARGVMLFVTDPLAGWAQPGTESFDAERTQGRDGKSYGPLPRDWAHYQGLSLHGNKVVLQYRVGDTEIRELPASEDLGAMPAFSRTVEVGPRTRDLLMHVARQAGSTVSLSKVASAAASVSLALFEPSADSGSAGEPGSFAGNSCLLVERPEEFDFANRDFTITARIKTSEGGTILSKAAHEGNWLPHGVTLFVRGGKLCYDIGWVGAVESDTKVADGKWHRVAAAFDSERGELSLWVDGEQRGERRFRPEKSIDGAVRVGFTAANFPAPRSAFRGGLEDVRVYSRRLSENELAGDATSTDALQLHVSIDANGQPVDRSPGTRQLERRNVTGGGGAAVKAPFEQTGTRRAVALLTQGADAALRRDAEGGLSLAIPRGSEPLSFKLVYTLSAADEDLGDLGQRVSRCSVAPSLTRYMRGGPRHWTEEATSSVEPFGPTGGPFEVETLQAPLSNPYRSWMRLSALDFLPGGDEVAVSTWMGDVWLVSGLQSDSGKLRWRRIASGLFQPLGLVYKEGLLYVLGRDQITRLRDLNDDGEIDYYENFNNDAQVTEHFHEFAMDLQLDSEGNFYYMKGGRHALKAVVPHHGTLLKVTADGASTEILANGFRAPNGLALNKDPSGMPHSFVISDQEGHWTPANRINWVTPGSFSGYMWGYHDREESAGYDPPLCWIDHDIDISPAEQLWVESEKFGALNGQLLSLSYGTGHIHLVLREEVEGTMQGGLVRLPIETFPTGIMRGRFHEADGDLYLCGLFGWSSRRTSPGGLFRIRPGKTPLQTVVGLRTTSSGVELEFSEPLDPSRAARVGSYQVERWNYKWASRYGSDDFKVSDGTKGREEMEIKQAIVSEGGRKVQLILADMQPAMQMRIRIRGRTPGGERLALEVFNTVHVVK